MQALRDKTVVLCMKGLEMGTGQRLSQIAGEYLHPVQRGGRVAWPGPRAGVLPGHPQLHGHRQRERGGKAPPGAGVFQRPDPLFYYGGDMIGNEVGAAAKNVVGIAAGFSTVWRCPA